MTILNLILLLAEAVVASVVLPGLAALLARAFPRNAARRRLVWTALFLILLALPLVGWLAPTLAVITLPAPPAAAAPAMAVAAAIPAPETAEPAIGGLAGAILIGLSAWALGAAWFLARGLVGLVWLERLRLGSKRAPLETLPLVLPPGCKVRLSPDCPGPMTWSAVRPVILLPDDAPEWPRERLEAALRHELAHVAAADSLMQALAMIACALYWPNPIVWRSARALRREAEAAADDAVIAAGVRPSDYASLLLDLAKDWRSPRRPIAEMAMAAPPILSERVQSILSPDAMRNGATVMDTFKLTLVGGAALAALALARPSIAEVSAPAPAPQTLAFAPTAPAMAQTTQHLQLQLAAAAEAKPRTTTTQHVELKPAAAPPEVSALLADNQALSDAPAIPAPPAVSVQPLPAPVAPAPPAPPAPAARPFPAPLPAPGAGPGWTGGWIPNPDGPRPGPLTVVRGRLTPEQRADLDRELAGIGPAIDKALKDAHVEESVQRALKDQDPKTREMVTKQLADLGPRIQRIIEAAHIQELVAQRMAEAFPNGQLPPDWQARAAERAQAQAKRAEERAQTQAKRAEERARQREQRQREDHPAPQPPKT